MNIDFHYGVVYIVARIGGLSRDDAYRVAYACQYVDDATTHGILRFNGLQTFDRFASAHEMADFHNLLQQSVERVWAPFHFLPACAGTDFDERAVCRPNSEPARDLVRHILHARRDPAKADNILHRLGVCLHTYVDTWAHQGFSGIHSDRNLVKRLHGPQHTSHKQWQDSLQAEIEHAKEHFSQAIRRAATLMGTSVLSEFSRVGHGLALYYPDLPWAEWSYEDHRGKLHQRDNLPQFVEAADMACKAVQAFVASSEDFTGQPGLGEAGRADIRLLLGSNTEVDGTVRLEAIHQQLQDHGVAGLHEDMPRYVGKGEGSWKHAATGIHAHTGDAMPGLQLRPDWSAEFETSDYRKVHDAIKQHRHFVTDMLLPSYGMRLA
ncbi:MAG: hypothetical protein KGL44_05895 [Sphingomonadales bacterium]|nr:hypothetical protein [Sphingomonadales bacterium]